MGDNSGIEWTDATWNPIVGCSIKSPGCTYCYAMRDAMRVVTASAALKRPTHYADTVKLVKGRSVWTGRLASAPDHIFNAPLHWKKPRTIFVNSMGDLFHEDTPFELIDRAFAIMALTPWHTYQVLTKRSDIMRKYVSQWFQRLASSTQVIDHPAGRRPIPEFFDWAIMPRVLRNVWLGVSTERQEEAEERVPDLLQTPAAVRFISAEPLLGRISLHALRLNTNEPWDAMFGRRANAQDDNIECPKLDWVIAGGESGKHARPTHIEWVRALREQCEAAGTKFFFKQWGEWLPWGQFPSADIDDPPEQTKFLTHEWENERWNDVGYPQWCDFADGAVDDEQCVGRVGRSKAGRLLDGREHNDMPQGQS